MKHESENDDAPENKASTEEADAEAEQDRRVVSLTDFIDQLERRAFMRSLDNRRSDSWETIRESLPPE